MALFLKRDGAGAGGAGTRDGAGADSARTNVSRETFGAERGTSARGRTSRVTPAWHGTAFFVEALVLLAFLVAAIAVFMSLFAAARAQSDEAAQLTDAVLLAQEVAEVFAADPAEFSAESEAGAAAGEPALARGGLSVHATATVEPCDDGALYHAVIAVTPDGENEAVYELETARYVADAADADAAASSNADDGAPADAAATSAPAPTESEVA